MDDPTNGELALMVSDLSRSTSASLARIESQTTKTNGRVTKLEEYKNMAVGGLIIMNLIVLPMLLTLLFKYVLK